MSNISIKCKNCGSILSVNLDSKIATCEHCGSSFLLSSLLDEKDIKFLSYSSQKNIDKKINYNEKIKNGESFLAMSEFLKAEEAFKQALEIDAEDYHSYYGLVKAKTQNLNKIPSTPDYKEYAKLALSHSYGDEREFIKHEFEKLDYLETEKRQKEKLTKQELKTKNHNDHIQKRHANFFSKLAYSITGLVAVAVFVGIILSIHINEKDTPEPTQATIEVSSVSDFVKFANNADNYGSTIVLTSDLDFENASILPIGSLSTPFTGTFYGNKHKIKNLNINPICFNGEIYAGLFGVAENATITGIYLENVSISPEDLDDLPLYAGLLCSYAKNSSIKQCAISSSCKINLNLTNISSVSGLVAKAENCSISLSYSNANLSTSNVNKINSIVLAGLVANPVDTQILNSYSSSIIVADCNSETTIVAGGIAGLFSGTETTLSACSFMGQIDCETDSENIYLGGIVGEQDSLNIGPCYVLCLDDSFIINGYALNVEDVLNYSNQNVSFLSFDEFSAITSVIFSSTYWTNVDSLSPSLK